MPIYIYIYICMINPKVRQNLDECLIGVGAMLINGLAGSWDKIDRSLEHATTNPLKNGPRVDGR